ncbi:MAG: DUF4919 domain-containing protein [Rikenellaceae bacterium]
MRSKSTRFKAIALFLTMTLSAFYADRAFCASKSEFVVPDYDSIYFNINRVDSDNFYPKIYERFAQGDTTLTNDNFHHLYYGFTFSETYNPLAVNPMKDSLMVVMQQNRDANFISPEIFNDMERVAIKSLAVNPFDMGVLNMLAFIYQMQGDRELSEQYAFKVRKIKEVILASGDGSDKKTPIHVTSRTEQDAIIASLALDYFKRSYVTIDIEVLHLNGRYNGKKGFYFNIGRMWSRVPAESEDDGPRRFEFNPTTNPKSKSYVRPT